MDTANLIHMANRIADFFAAQPGHEEGLQGIAEHLRKFWEPRMRARIVMALTEPDAVQQMHPMLREALQRYQGEIGAVKNPG